MMEVATGITVALVIVGIGAAFLCGVCALAKGFEVLNEYITKWN